MFGDLPLFTMMTRLPCSPAGVKIIDMQRLQAAGYSVLYHRPS
jgi:hypothetical protein